MIRSPAIVVRTANWMSNAHTSEDWRFALRDTSQIFFAKAT